MFPILQSPLPPSLSLSLPCHSTLLNCSSNGKDGSVEMERIEKRRGGNQWDNRQGRGPEQRGWPLHWSEETTHAHTWYHNTLLLQYVQYTQSQASTLACSRIQKSLSRLAYVRAGSVCGASGWWGGAGVMAINCAVLSLLFGADWGWCAGCRWR